jgi:C-terminal processing protease CtpA/Prc
MKVGNDAFTRMNRAVRQSQAGDRTVELIQPLGLELDEDEEKNVYVKSIDADGRAARTGKIFVGDRIAMASATFGNDMWSCRGVGLSRVLTAIRMRNTSPVRLVLEAPDEAEEIKRRAIAYAEASEEQKKLEKEVSLARVPAEAHLNHGCS